MRVTKNEKEMRWSSGIRGRVSNKWRRVAMRCEKETNNMYFNFKWYEEKKRRKMITKKNYWNKKTKWYRCRWKRDRHTHTYLSVCICIPSQAHSSMWIVNVIKFNFFSLFVFFVVDIILVHFVLSSCPRHTSLAEKFMHAYMRVYINLYKLNVLNTQNTLKYTHIRRLALPIG